jgi:hypothetical protein
MKILLDRSYKSQKRFYLYTPIENQGGKYIGRAKEISSYSRPLYLIKYEDEEVCRLEDDNLIRPWLGLFSMIFPFLRAKYTLKMDGLKENSIISYNGDFYSIKIGKDFYEIKGHSNCVVSIWKNEQQVGLIKRINSYLGNGFETIEVLYERHIPEQLIMLFSVFGWEVFVGRINGNSTLTTISLSKDTFDTNWQPKE